MVDFVGQRRVFMISLWALVLSVPISITIGYISGNYMYALYFVAGVTGLLMIAFVPNWPYLNVNKVAWRPDSDVTSKRPQEEDHPTGGARRRRH